MDKDEYMIPYAVHEGELARSERNIKRLWIALILFVVLLFASNMAWLYEWTQYDYSSYEQDGDGVNLIGNTNKVDYNNVTETQDKNQKE
ncbi:MAG: hypothetical protein IKR26_03380 [Lachnospiraceae bacterium]|nr:hypothetical protein [Lachnospiraceae bacterium]